MKAPSQKREQPPDYSCWSRKRGHSNHLRRCRIFRLKAEATAMRGPREQGEATEDCDGRLPTEDR